MTKTCLFCAYWKPEGTIIKIDRFGAKCSTTGQMKKQEDTCWGWRICSPSQLDERKNAGLIEEVKGNEQKI